MPNGEHPFDEEMILNKNNNNNNNKPFQIALFTSIASSVFYCPFISATTTLPV